MKWTSEYVKLIEHRETDNFLRSIDSFPASRESSDIGLES